MLIGSKNGFITQRGANVSIVPTLQTGTKIADFSVGKTTGELYAPSAAPIATSSTPGIVRPDGATIELTDGSSGILTAKIATTSGVGIVKPDNSTITVNASGVISANIPTVPVATSSTTGIVKPDNSTITVNASGVISANIPTVPIATDSIPGIVKPDGSTITIDASGMIKTNHSYVFNTPVQTTSTTDETDDTISVELANRAINIVPLATTVKYLSATFPQITTGYARDFFVRLVITGDVPTISFSEYGGGLPNFDIVDDAWSDMEQGANVIMFTETSQP